MHKRNGLLPAKKKLWIITELYFPENNQTGYYMTQIGEGLTCDFDVKIICSQPNYASRGTVAPRHEILNGVEIFRVRGTTLNKNVMVFRLVNMLTNGWSVFFKALFRIKPGDQILAVSAPPSLPFVSAAAAKLKNVDYSLILHDKYPEQLVATGKLRKDSIMVRILNRLNLRLYLHARKIVVVGRDMKEVVQDQLGPRGDERKIEVVPNWAALEEIEPQAKQGNPLLEKMGIGDKFIFLYAGNMGHPQDVESIIECASRLRDHPDIRFVFIGGGFKRRWVRKEMENRHLANVFLLDEMPRDQQTTFLNVCDVGFVSLVKKMYGLAVPSRMYNLLAAGKPILAITERGSEVERVMLEDRVGWTVEPENADALFVAINEIYEARDQLEDMSKRARAAAVSKYNRDRSIQKYRKVLGLPKVNVELRTSQ
jgi:colanic acid biosynthesis glycosyl transferase WcaI